MALLISLCANECCIWFLTDCQMLTEMEMYNTISLYSNVMLCFYKWLYTVSLLSITNQNCNNHYCIGTWTPKYLLRNLFIILSHSNEFIVLINNCFVSAGETFSVEIEFNLYDIWHRYLRTIWFCGEEQSSVTLNRYLSAFWLMYEFCLPFVLNFLIQNGNENNP